MSVRAQEGPPGVWPAEELLALAVSVTRKAGELVRGMRDGAIAEVGAKSTVTDMVTTADRAAERLIIDELLAARPGDVVVGEETGRHGGAGPADPKDPAGPAGPVRWLVDPIDGTVNYVYGLPYAVSVAAEVGGEVVAGVVRSPVTGEEWTAVRGGGAFRDGTVRLAGSTATDLSRALVATGFGYDPARRVRQVAVLSRLLPEIADIRRLGVAAVDLCCAAEGRVDAYYERGVWPWDHAAGGLIAEEAGLRVSVRPDPEGSALLIAAPPALYPALAARLEEYGAAEPW